jgi:hypothetical protein
MEQRLARSTRIPLRRRLRFAYRALAAWLGRFAAADGHAAAARESTAQLAAREAGERKAAIDGSIGAMSPADIRRFINPAGMDETGHIARR